MLSIHPTYQAQGRTSRKFFSGGGPKLAQGGTEFLTNTFNVWKLGSNYLLQKLMGDTH